MMKEVDNLVKCLKKNCKESDTVVSLVEEMKALTKTAPDKKNIKRLESVIEKMKNHKVSLEAQKCQIENCSKQYVKLQEKRLQESAEMLDNTLQFMRKMQKLKEMEKSEAKAKKPKK